MHKPIWFFSLSDPECLNSMPEGFISQLIAHQELIAIRIRARNFNKTGSLRFEFQIQGDDIGYQVSGFHIMAITDFE